MVERACPNLPVFQVSESTFNLNTILEALKNKDKYKFHHLVSISCVYARDPVSFSAVIFYILSSNCCDLDAILLLLRVCPAAAKVADEKQNLILHYAACLAKSDCKERLLKKLLEIYPESCDLTNAQGENVLHILLCHVHPPKEVIEMILRLRLNSCCTFTKSGKLPLHYLLNYNRFKDPDPNLVRILVQANPAAVCAEVEEEIIQLSLFGAAPKIRRNVWTPLSRARDKGFCEAEMIMSWGLRKLGLRAVTGAQSTRRLLIQL